MSKSQEFEALIHGKNTTLDVIAWTQRNVSLVARALRRDEPFAPEVVARIAAFTGRSSGQVLDVLAAYREYVQ